MLALLSASKIASSLAPRPLSSLVCRSFSATMCSSSSPPPPASKLEYSSLPKKEQIRELLNSIETGDPGPVAVVNESKYIQHNPLTREGSEGLAALYKRLSLTEPRVNMVRAFEDGDFVFAHMEYDFSSRKICFEVFRFEQGQAVEHWDNIVPRLPPNPSGHSMVDGATQVEDRPLTEANRAFARSFVESVLIGNQPERLGEFINEQGYVEHNPHLGDDVQLLKAKLEAVTDTGRLVEYQQLHRVLAEGNFVLCVSEGFRDGVHSSFYDLFRIAQGKIVEHWDTTEEIPPRSEWKNNNGKF